MSIKLLGLIFTSLKYFKHKIFSSNRYNLTRRVVQYIESKDCDLPVEEKRALKKFLSCKLVSQISHPFIKEYNYRLVKVLWDNIKSLHYVRHNEKKLYFKKGLSKANIREMYNTLCIEQDIRSPHSYFVFPVSFHSSDIAVDIGAAEGIWALDIVDKVKRLYLFECEDGWIEALNATFEPWKDKVTIINKFVTDNTDERNTTLDYYFLTNQIFPTIIKVDIEGAEISGMKGACKLLSHHICHAFICTYHHVDDFALLSEMMRNHHFKVQSTEGHMITTYSEPDFFCNDIAKLFRKGVIHARK